MVFGAVLIGTFGFLAARRGVHAYRRTKQEMEQERYMYNSAGQSSRSNYYGQGYPYSFRSHR